MRRALWILSAPVFAGGLAWAVSAADSEAPLLAKAPAPQAGKVYYFSRSGKDADSEKVDASRDHLLTAAGQYDFDDADGEVPASRYTRKSSKPKVAQTSGVRNYYDDLFGQAEAAPKTKSSKKPIQQISATATQQRRVVEECGVAGEFDENNPPRETHQIPGAGAENGKSQLVNHSGDERDVRHALHKERAGAKNTVQQVQNQGKTAAASPKSGSATPRVGRTNSAVARTIPEPADEDLGDLTAPPPPNTRTAKATASKSTRTASAGTSKNTAAAQPKASRNSVTQAAAKQPISKKVEHVAATEDELDEAPVAGDAPKVHRVAALPMAPAAAVSADTPMITIRWISGGDINVGQECKCGLVVKNTGRLAAKDILVEAFFPKTCRLLDAEPFPSESKDHLVWKFDNFEAGEEKVIQIAMIPGKKGELTTSASVRFTGVATNVLQVEEPQLAVAVSGSKDVMVGETVSQIITVSNPGTGVAHDVVIHAVVPAGLEHTRGKQIELAVGSLGAGESREVRLPLAAVAGGPQVVQIEARAASNLVQKTQASISVAAPKLKIAVAGPSLRYVNRNAQYVIGVTNDGIAATDNVRIVHLIPEGFEFVKADKGGKHDYTSGSVSWFIGRLEAGQSAQVAVDLNAKQIGEYQHHVQATGENGSVATAKLDTQVDGASAIVMEVIDINDPIEVGTETAYEIRIRNDGSKAAQNVRLACDLPAGMVLMGTEGPTTHAIDKGVLHFRAIDQIAPGGKVSYRVRVIGKTAGNLRLRAKLTSNAATEPLIVEELTKFYAD